jgi:hypothetical protein
LRTEEFAFIQQIDRTIPQLQAHEELQSVLVMLGETRKWALKFRKELHGLAGISKADVMCKHHSPAWIASKLIDFL